MFLKLTVEGISRGDLGWIISKHPESEYNRENKSGRKITGNWCDFELEKTNNQASYLIKVINDPILFLDKHRQENRSHYVDIRLHSITNFNLTLVLNMLRSVLTDSINEKATKKDDLFSIRIMVGVSYYNFVFLK